MRLPVRSETEAFRLVVASVVMIGISVAAGVLTEPLVGAAVFGCVFILAAIAYLRAENPDRRPALGAAIGDPHPHGARDGTRHVLVVANEVLCGDELRDRIAGAGGAGVEVDVLAPVLASRLHYGLSDIDREPAQAQLRLERSLAWAREHGIIARGTVGDPNPATAIEDELRDWGADEVIVVTSARDRVSWQERDELQRLRRELPVPVTHVGVGTASAPV